MERAGGRRVDDDQRPSRAREWFDGSHRRRARSPAGEPHHRTAGAGGPERGAALRSHRAAQPGKKLGKDKDARRKLGKKQKKPLKDAHRPLDSWERYRALTDALDEAIDLVDLADHKARFALVIMAAVNVVLFFSADAPDPLKARRSRCSSSSASTSLVYILVALYFFLQAIESLRPRKSQPQVPPATQTGIEEFPLGIRFYEDILRRDVDDYKKAWQEVRIGQLNAELAVQAHALAQINRAKYAALRRLYKGLQIMTLMAVGLVALGGLRRRSWGRPRRRTKPPRAGEDILGHRAADRPTPA